MEIELISTFKGHLSAVYTLCPGENHSLFSAGSDGLICQWNTDDSDQGLSVARMDDRVFSLLYTASNKTLYAGTMSGDLFSLHLGRSREVRRFRFHSKSIYRLGLWNEILISVGGDGILSLWNGANGQWLTHLQLSNSKLRSLALDIKHDLVYTGDGNGKLFSLKLPNLSLIHQIPEHHDKTIFSLMYVQEEEQLISGGIDARLKCIDHQFNVVKELKSHWFAVNDICELTGTDYFATASRDKTIRIWTKRNLDLVKEISRPKFAAHSHSVNSLCWMESKQTLFSAGDDGMIYGWKINL